MAATAAAAAKATGGLVLGVEIDGVRVDGVCVGGRPSPSSRGVDGPPGRRAEGRRRGKASLAGAARSRGGWRRLGTAGGGRRRRAASLSLFVLSLDFDFGSPDARFVTHHDHASRSPKIIRRRPKPCRSS
ncbi:hypothetical protein ACHAWF_003670 [Thalassiosira exigua]